MTRFTEAYDFHGRTLVDREGEKIGTVDEVYSSQESGPPEWALVHTGLLGTRNSFCAVARCLPGRWGRARGGRQAGRPGFAQRRG